MLLSKVMISPPGGAGAGTVTVHVVIHGVLMVLAVAAILAGMAWSVGSNNEQKKDRLRQP